MCKKKINRVSWTYMDVIAAQCVSRVDQSCVLCHGSLNVICVPCWLVMFSLQMITRVDIVVLVFSSAPSSSEFALI
jgi:hypothetical protein